MNKFMYFVRIKEEMNGPRRETLHKDVHIEKLHFEEGNDEDQSEHNHLVGFPWGFANQKEKEGR